MPRILLLTTEPLPLPGVHAPTTGAGLRAYGLAVGLASRGIAPLHIATVAQAPEGWESPRTIPHGITVHHIRRDAIGSTIESLKPDGVLMQHWGLLPWLPELSIPLAIDLAGPHLLERLHWGDNDPQDSLRQKLEALRRADFLVCSGRLQRLYFLAYLHQAGWDLRRSDVLPVVPYGVPSAPVSELMQPRDHGAPHDPTFVYGGAFLAWQDPSRPLAWLLDELDRAQKGRLLFYGGAHPELDASGGRFADIVMRLRAHPRVEMRPFRPLEQLAAEYAREGDVALDLFARNCERELAYATRTVVYWWCGLPTIHNNYAETGDLIARRGGGWAIDPEDEVGFREVVRSILDGTADLNRLRGEALVLARSHAFEDVITPLVPWAEHPTFREGKTRHRLAVEAGLHELSTARKERDAALSRLHSLEGKITVRLALALPTWISVFAPLAWLAMWPVSWYVRWRLRKGSGRRK